MCAHLNEQSAVTADRDSPSRPADRPGQNAGPGASEAPAVVALGGTVTAGVTNLNSEQPP
jgi:hypothetical protein